MTEVAEIISTGDHFNAEIAEGAEDLLSLSRASRLRFLTSAAGGRDQILHCRPSVSTKQADKWVWPGGTHIANAECMNRDGAALNALAHSVIGGAMAVHRALGPGLLESAYLACLCYELHRRTIPFELQKAIPLLYEGVKIDCAYRADLIVGGQVILEIKAADAIAPIHSRQLYTYLRLARLPLGLVLNFGQETMKAGIKRVVNNFPE